MEPFSSALAGQAGFDIVGDPLVGGQSHVYQAYHSVTDRMVALKVYRDTTSDQVLREAAALAALRHPNVANFVGVGYIGRLPYVASEWVQGERLFDVLSRQERLSIDVALNLIFDITAGLAAVHQLKQAHGDVSPANVIVKPDGQAVIVDFGLGGSQCQSTKTARSSITGTLRYIAPEIILGKQPTVASDQYAVGVLLYEMLAGCWPFGSRNHSNPPSAASALHHHLYTEATPLIEQRPETSKTIDAAVGKALNKDPAHRHVHITAFSNSLKGSQLAAHQDRSLSQRLPRNDYPGQRWLNLKNKRLLPWGRSKIGPRVPLSCAHTNPVLIATVIVSVLAGTSVLFAYAGSRGYLSPAKPLNHSAESTAQKNREAAGTSALQASGNITTVENNRFCNLMPNPYFNTPLTDNFYKDAENPDVVSIIDDQERESTPLLRVGDADQYGLYGQIIRIEPDNEYIFSAAVYASDEVEDARLIVSWLDRDWQIMESQDQFIRVEAASGPVVFEGISPPDRAHFAVPSVFKNASRGTLLVDDLVFSTTDSQCL